MSAPKYPFVECGYDHLREPGYVVCKHCVNHGAPAFSVEKATSKNLGKIMCIDCARRPPVMNENNFVLCCAQCCRNNELLD